MYVKENNKCIYADKLLEEMREFIRDIFRMNVL